MTFDEWRESNKWCDPEKGRFIWDASAKAEREACAKVCETLPADDPTGPWFNDDMTMAAIDCANAIRARNTAEGGR